MNHSNPIQLFLHGLVAAQCSSAVFEDDLMQFSDEDQCLFRKWKGNQELWENVEWLPIFQELVEPCSDEESIEIYNTIVQIALTHHIYAFTFAQSFKEMLDHLHRVKYVQPLETVHLFLSVLHHLTAHSQVQILGFLMDCWVNHTTVTTPLDECEDWPSIQAKCTHSLNVFSMNDVKFHSDYLRENFPSNSLLWRETWRNFCDGETVMDDRDVADVWDKLYEWLETGESPLDCVLSGLTAKQILQPLMTVRTSYVHVINQSELIESLTILAQSVDNPLIHEMLSILYGNC